MPSNEASKENSKLKPRKSEKKVRVSSESKKSNSTSSHDRKRKSKSSPNRYSPLLNLSDTTNELDSDCWTCRMCLKNFCDDNDKLAVCERCSKPVCLACSDLSEKDYANLSSENCPFLWCCQVCKAPALKAMKTDNDIEQKCKEQFELLSSELREEMKSMKDRIDNLEKKNDSPNLKQTINELIQVKLNEIKTSSENSEKTYANVVAGADGMKKDNAQIVKDSIGEINDRERRKLNIIIYNVEESKSDDLDERKKHDLKEANDLVKEIGVHDKVNISRPVRLFKSKKPEHANKPRPLRVMVESEEQRRLILQGLKNVEEGKKSKLKTIFMKRDMTPLERQERMMKNRKTNIKNADQESDKE